MNFHKSFVVPIRCANLNLDDILLDIPAKRESFPLRYLGLPLRVRCLRRKDIQHLEEKSAQGIFPLGMGNTSLWPAVPP
jgi:hypothetical protein